MVELVSNLRSFVESEHFLHALDVDTLDDFLDHREIAPFDFEWVRVHHLVKKQNRGSSDSIDFLRELTFKRAYFITSSPDASGTISDDIGLIGDALLADVSDPWLSSLAASYVSGGIPSGELDGESRSVQEIISGCLY